MSTRSITDPVYSAEENVGSVDLCRTGPVGDALLKSVDMSDEMCKAAVDVATAALKKQRSVADMADRDVAMTLKKYFDKHYGLTWHCIVGKNFGSYVTYDTRHFAYFFIGNVAVLLFRTS